MNNIKLVFSDVVLPDKNAINLIDELIVQSPDLRVVLTSGYPKELSQWGVIKDRGYKFLQKPYDISELLQVIKESLQSR